MLRYLLEKEFKQIRRDRFMPKIIFIIPIMQCVVEGDHLAFRRAGILECETFLKYEMLRYLLEKVQSAGLASRSWIKFQIEIPHHLHAIGR